MARSNRASFDRRRRRNGGATTVLGLAGAEIIDGKDMVYFKRHYKDGSTRPARLRVNDFVARHLKRQKGATPTVALAPRTAANQPSLQNT